MRRLPASRRFYQHLFLIVSTFFAAPSALALSSGCAAVNALSGSTTLSFSSNRYAASSFAPGDTLTVSFTDTGAAAGRDAPDSDSLSVARYNLLSFQTYNAADTTSSSPHTVSISVPAGSLETNGMAVRADASRGQLSNLTFNCTSTATVSTDATLSNLTLSQGTLAPAFRATTTNYSASVDNSVNSVNVTPVTNESHATVTVNGTTTTSGSPYFIPLAVGSNSTSVVVTAEDGNTVRSYTLTVTRAPATPPPAAANSSTSVAANSANNTVPLSLSGGSATSVSIDTTPLHGTLTQSGINLTYTPLSGYSGSDSFTYHASNSSGNSGQATVSITVTAPTLSFTPSASTLPPATAGSAWSQTLSVSGGTAPYNWSASGLPPGITLSSGGILSGTPTTPGSYTFQITAADSNNASGNINYTLTVNEALPVASNVSATFSANSSGNTVPLALSGGAATSIAVVTQPAHGSTTVSGITITYTPAAGFSGSDSFTYSASNGSGTSAPAQVSLTVASHVLMLSPAAGALPVATTGKSWTQTVTASGGTAPYTFSATGLPAGIILNSSSGELAGTPTTAGSYTIQLSASDSLGSNGKASYTLTVNGTPPVTGAVNTSVNAGSADNPLPLNLSEDASFVTVVTQPAHGRVTVSGLRLFYTPARGYTGSDSFTYSAINAAGLTSAPATVTLNVTAVPLALLPAGGTLPQGSAGKSYSQTFSVSGGTAPYRWQLSGDLPAGLTFTDGQLSGVPGTAGTSTLTVTTTDAAGSTTQGNYSLTIAAALPVAVDHSASLFAGQSVDVSLTDGASGGPFSAARLLDQPDSALGTAEIRSSGSSYQLRFTAAARASGTVSLRYVLTGASGTSQPAQVTLTIATRPDPSRDADVIGMISAQYQAAQNFARAQLRNFGDRLEQLHSGAVATSGLNGIHFSMPSSGAEHDADKEMWNSAWQQQSGTPLANSGQPVLPSLPFSSQNKADKLAYWTGGYVDFGGDKAGGIHFSHTTVGITTGADYRFTPAFTGGLGIGFGRDVSDIGDDGTRSNGRAFSSALYGSYHPNGFFIDGLAGHSLLDFDSKRSVSETDAEARGSRSARQVFSSLTTGYEFRSPDSLLSPYARLQYYRTSFDGFSESGAGAFNLAFAPQTVSQVISSAGLRGEHLVPASWGLVKLQGRVEYAQMLNENNSARVGYADVASDTWRMPVFQQSREAVTLGTGIDFLLPYNITPGLSYQGTLGLDAQHTRDQMVMIRVNIGF